MIPLAKKIKHLLFVGYLQIKRKYRSIKNEPIIHVFGDSHSLLFQHELFKIHHIGPATAYNLRSKKSTTNSREKIYKEISTIHQNENTIFLFIFGEIDCRIHIHKVSKKSGLPLKKVIKDTVQSYGTFLIEIRGAFPKSRILVFNVLPAGEEKNIYNVAYYPSRKLHMEIVREFNKQLEQFSRKNGLTFIPLFDELLGERGERKTKYIFDPIHYNKKIIPFIIGDLQKKHVI